MEFLKLLNRLAKLHRIAENQKGTPEGDNAHAMFLRSKEDSPIKLEDDAFDSVEKTMDIKMDWDGDVARILAQELEIKVHGLENNHRVVVFGGIKILVDEATRHYSRLQKELERITGFATLGFLFRTFGPDVAHRIIGSDDVCDSLRAGAEIRSGTQSAPDISDLSDAETKFMMEAAKLSKPIKFWQGAKTTFDFDPDG